MISIYITGLALIAAVSWAVARPLFRAAGAPEGRPAGLPDDERWRKQKDDALGAIRDTELDYHVGKLSEADYREMRRELEARALEAIHALEGGARGDSR